MDLFDQAQSKKTLSGTPLAERLRPKTTAEILGQNQSLGEGKPVARLLTAGKIQNLILWGPPGCGKTSFALALSEQLEAEFIAVNAIDTGAKALREIGQNSHNRRRQLDRQTVVFVDEIHRLTKSQQDVFLPFVEKGDFILIGATTENPSYELNRALMSRCRLVEFARLDAQDFDQLLQRAREELKAELKISESAKAWLIEWSDGDGRRFLNAVENLYLSGRFDGEKELQEDGIEDWLGTPSLPHDKTSDSHYDLASAMIKSVRGSDPDASVYYLARLIKGSEDPKFIARRLVILASEDIGNADPKALSVAMDGFRAVEVIGMPEARITLSQVAIYLAGAPKSNSAYKAIGAALAEVEQSGSQPIPKSIRSAKTSLMKSIGYGKEYKYSHDGATGFVAQNFLPTGIKLKKFYEPVLRGYEKHMGEYLQWMKGEAKKD